MNRIVPEKANLQGKKGHQERRVGKETGYKGRQGTLGNREMLHVSKVVT